MSKLAVSICCIMVGAGTLWAVQPAQDQRDGQPQQRPERGPGGPERGPGGPGGGFGGQGRQASVEAGMKMMNRAARTLNTQISDASKKEDNIRLINDMQRGCATAKGLPLPAEFFKDVKDDAAKAKITAEYRADLIKIMRSMIDVEVAISEGKTAEAKAGLDAIEKIRQASHTRLGVKEE